VNLMERELWIIDQQLEIINRKLSEDVFSIAENTEETTEIELLQQILEKISERDCL